DVAAAVKVKRVALNRSAWSSRQPLPDGGPFCPLSFRGWVLALPESPVSISPLLSEGHRAKVHRRTLIVVMFSQILGGAGLAARISVGALLAQDKLGSDSLSGLPTGMFTLGSAMAAFLVCSSTQRFGRRLGLAYGFMAGGLGALGV